MREDASPKQPVVRKTLPLWRNRDYLLLIGGQGVSAMGTQVSDLAYILLVLALTNSPAQVGGIGAMRVLPALLLGIPAGVLVDRWDRKRLMIFCDCGRALCLASIPVVYALGHLTLPQLYLTAFVEAALATFFDLAERSCLPQIVSREQLSTASAQNQAVSYTSLTVGPPLSGILYSIGHVFPFLIDAISYVVSVVSLLFIKTPFQERREQKPRHVLTEMQEGIVWLWHQPLLRFMTLLIGSLNLTVAGIDLIVVILAQQQHASSFVIGLIFAIGSIGGIAGAFVAPYIQKHFSYGQAIIVICWITALLWPLFAIAPNIIIIGLIFAAYLIWGRIMSVVNFTYRTAITPDRMQGRSLGIASIIVRTAPPAGIALTGIFIQHFGVIATILTISASRVLIAIIASFNPHVRNVPPASEIATP